MADFSLPTLTSTYANFLLEVKARDEDLAKMFDGTTSTNIPTGAKRWNATTNKWEKYSGTAWSDMSTLYGIKVEDSNKLNGQLAAYYATAAHTHSNYSLTTHDHSTLYAALSHNHSTLYLGITDTAADSSKVGGYEAAQAATASTAAIRDGSADITARLFRSNYAEQTTAPATTVDICFRNDAASDNYMRFMDATAFKAWLLAIGTTVATAQNANQLIGKNWYWSGQGGQPSWLWGGTDGTNMYVYNPSNFSVNYANSAGSAGNGINSWNFTVRTDDKGHKSGSTYQYRCITAMNINGAVKEIVTGEYNCWSNCNCSSCFVEGQPVLMADGSYKNIEDVKVGDYVKGAYGEEDINIVTHLQRPPRGDRTIYDINGLLITDEHGIVDGEREGFLYMSLENHYKEANTFQTCLDAEGNEVEVFFAGTKADNCKKAMLIDGSAIYGENGREVVDKIIETDLKPQTLYHLVLDGFSRTYSVSGKFVSGYADSDLFDYELGIKREVK